MARESGGWRAEKARLQVKLTFSAAHCHHVSHAPSAALLG